LHTAAGDHCFAQDQKPAPATLKGILLEQLRTTHNTNDWFVAPSKAVRWPYRRASLLDRRQKATTPSANSPITWFFWNSRELAKFQKASLNPNSGGNNEETFDKFDAKTWSDTVKHLDQVMSDLEKFVDSASDAQLAKFGSEIAHIGTHNGYHTGQIIYIRRSKAPGTPAKA